MGQSGTKIVKVDVDQLLEKLNKALADEWLAYYQYWIGAKVAVGMMRPIIVKEMVEHAGEELEHANMLVERILALGGEPLLSPQDWFEQANCKYETPDNSQTKALLKQNIDAERCAIEVYQDLLEFVTGKDTVTEGIVRQILADEVEHEDELEAIADDMRRQLLEFIVVAGQKFPLNSVNTEEIYQVFKEV